MAVIARSKIIRGAKNDNFWVGGQAGKFDHLELLVHPPEVRALHTTPKALLPALVPTRAYLIAGVGLHKFSGAYVGGDDVNFRFTDSASQLIGTVPQALFTVTAEGFRWATPDFPTTLLAMAFPPGAGVEMSVDAAFTGNGGQLYVLIQWTIIEI